MSFPVHPLGNIAELHDSLHQTPSYSDEGTPMVRVTDISMGYLDVSSCRKVDASTYLEFIKNHRPNVGDILFSRVGSYGNSCYVKVYEEFCLGQNTVCISANTKSMEPYFLYCLLNSNLLKNQIVSLATGASQKTISLESIRKLIVPTPPLPTQKKIASVLSAYDDLIENNERRIKILEEMAQSIYREWFVNYRFPGHENVRMVDSELGEIPEGWESMRLGSLVKDIRSGIDPSEADPNTPYVGLEHIPRKSMTLSDYGNIHSVSSNKLRFQQGDILFGKIRPYFHKVVIAPFAGICSSDTIVLRVNEPNMLPISLSTVFSEEFVAHSSATSQGTKMPRANWDVLSKYPVPVAPPTILQNFNDFFTNSINKCSLLVRENQNLRQTRDLLLPKLISEELDVEELDIVVV